MSSWQSKMVKSFFRLQRFRGRFRRRIPSIEESRARLEQLADDSNRRPPDFKHQPLMIEHVPAEWVYSTDKSREDCIILYLHGGAYSRGSINTHRMLAYLIAWASEGKALLIDYRLAPENKFPAALEDAEIAYRWLLDRYPAEQLAIAGDSAGGGLTLATMLKMRDEGVALPATAVCLSPWTDLAGTGETLVTKARAEPWLNPKDVISTAKLYLGDTDPKNPLASPLYADLHGLPPMLIQVGTAEILLSDSTRFAEKAREAGVDVTLEEWEGMLHVWQAFAHLIPEARQALRRIGEYIQGQMVLEAEG